jgi:hypothetical protein
MFGRAQQQLRQSNLLAVKSERTASEQIESTNGTAQITKAKEMQRRLNLEQRSFNFSSIGKWDDFSVAGGGVSWDRNTTNRGKIDSITRTQVHIFIT